ncbi:MAG TPA: SDR family NAD(P)-dependent oxidoreductase [Terriglobia bacterium]|nr:SDR family NAD(P)-dependent oxidoreductase [Terriglobia bacterium]
MKQTSKPLEGRVAVVAGATRGAGRGIARALGEAGAFVYCTGRSVRGNPSPYGRPETIDETADMIRDAGGNAIALRVDHTVESEVQGLFARVQSEKGRLDVLADSVAGEDPLIGSWANLDKLDVSRGVDAFRQCLLSHVITAKYALPPMIKKRRGLIVEVSEGDTITGSGGNILADLIKSSIKNIAFRLAWEMRKSGIAVIAITPGFLRSETMLKGFGVTEENWRDGGKKDPNFLFSETPLFVGRAVAALAADPNVLEKSGHLTSSWELSREYRFTDADGSRPDWGEHAKDIEWPDWLTESVEPTIRRLETMTERMRLYLPKGKQARL